MCLSVRNFRWTLSNCFLFKRREIVVLLLILGVATLFLGFKQPKTGYLPSRFRFMNFKDESVVDGIIRSSIDFENFNNNTGVQGMIIVPNVVHFIRFGNRNMTFVEAVCVLAALKNQKPDKLIIHTDYVQQGGKYWEVVTNHPLANGVLEVKFRPQTTTIFEQDIDVVNERFHSSDVARLEILMEEGGIYLDGDTYTVKSLDEFRKFEMTLGWQEGDKIATQVIIAHKDARFLKVWHESYRDDYIGYKRFYNSKEKPTKILQKQPHLIHRVKSSLAEQKPVRAIMRMIYLESNKKWTLHYAIHLRIRMRIDYYNDENILKYDSNIRSMALDVYPFPKNFRKKAS